jgi:adenylate cyclase class 2
MEVEIKSKINNIADMEEKLRSMGAIFVKDVVEVDEYFNHPCRDFAGTDEALRIRSDGTMTYKGPKVDEDTKSREEIEVKIENLEGMRSLLIALGFKPVAKVIKRRKYYRMGEITITLDDVEDVGTFIEVECLGDYGYCKKKVLELAKFLKLNKFIRESYLEMLLEGKN